MKSNAPLGYVLAEGADLDEVEARLAALPRCASSGRRRVDRRYLDTFDWRVHSAGAVLVEERDGARARLRWQGAGDAPAVAADVRADAAPRFAAELPDGALRRRLEPVSKVRVLFEQARLRGVARHFAIRDREGKTVVRVHLERLRAEDPASGRRRALRPRVTLAPVKGHRRPAERVRAVLEDELALLPVPDVFVEALRAFDREPGGGRAKPRPRLDPDTRADAAVKEILLLLLDVIEANVDGACENLDTEFLHDLRVAVRRARTLLGRLRGVLPRRRVERFQRGFRWLGAVTSPVRDLDVYLLLMEEHGRTSSAAEAADLQPVVEQLRDDHAAAHARMVRQLRSARARKLLAEWRRFLEAPVPARTRLEHATRPIGDVARERTRATWRRVLREGRAIDDESPAELLHELRKTCKKLRYLLELFRSVLPPGATRELVASLKELQSNLGDVQDLEIQADTLRELAERLSGRVGGRTLLAMGRLVEQLEERQRRARREFAACFSRFDSPDVRRRVRQVVRVSARAEA